MNLFPTLLRLGDDYTDFEGYSADCSSPPDKVTRPDPAGSLAGSL